MTQPGSCIRSKRRRNVGFDVETLARLVLRARGRRKECRARKLRRFLDQANQRRRVLRHADHLDLVAVDPKFGDIGAVGQRLRQRFQDDDARRARLFTPGEQPDRRVSSGAKTQRGAPLRNPARQLLLLGIKAVADIGADQQRDRGRGAGRQQDGAQDTWRIEPATG